MEKKLILKSFTLLRGMRIMNRKPMILLLLGICILGFFPTFFNDFQLAWDDTWQVLENPFANKPSSPDIFYHFTYFWQQQFSPVNSLFYLIIVKFFGKDASSFHAASLLIHLCNSLLIFEIMRKLVSRFVANAASIKVNVYSFFVALIFAIHPLQVESVAWISASKILLYAFFTLTALWCYIRYIRSSHFQWLIATILAYTLGFGSKEQAIILPLNLFLFDYVFGRFEAFTWKNILYSRVFLEKIPFFLLAIAFLYFSRINNAGTIFPEGGYPFYQRILFGIHSLVEYIFRFLAPAKLYFFHPFPISPGESLPLYYWGYIVLVCITGYYIWDNYRKGNQLVVFGFLFFLTNLLLVLHIIPMPRSVITADRYMYLSLAGLAVVLVWQVDQWITFYANKIGSLQIAFYVWLLFLGTQTFLRTADWKDSETAKRSVNEVIEKKRKAQKSETFFNHIDENE